MTELIEGFQPLSMNMDFLTCTDKFNNKDKFHARNAMEVTSKKVDSIFSSLFPLKIE